MIGVSRFGTAYVDRDRAALKVYSPKLRFGKDTDEFGINQPLADPDPLVMSAHYPKLVLFVTNFAKPETMEPFALQLLLNQLQADVKLKLPYHRAFIQEMNKINDQLRESEMFKTAPRRPLKERCQAAAQAGQLIAQMPQHGSKVVAAYERLRNLWMLSMVSNTQQEMARYTGLWVAYNSPKGRHKDQVTVMGVNDPSFLVRSLASLVAQDVQNPEQKQAVIGRMSLDSHLLIRLRAQVLKDPTRWVNRSLAPILFRKPTY